MPLLAVVVKVTVLLTGMRSWLWGKCKGDGGWRSGNGSRLLPHSRSNRRTRSLEARKLSRDELPLRAPLTNCSRRYTPSLYVSQAHLGVRLRRTSLSTTVRDYHFPWCGFAKVEATRLLVRIVPTPEAHDGWPHARGGRYLSNVALDFDQLEQPEFPQLNTVANGSPVIFTAQARWSDGVVRPFVNQDFDGLQGIWTSSNPAVMYINQQGPKAVAYGLGKTTI